MLIKLLSAYINDLRYVHKYLDWRTFFYILFHPVWVFKVNREHFLGVKNRKGEI